MVCAHTTPPPPPPHKTSLNDFNNVQVEFSTKSIKLSLNRHGERMVTRRGERFDVTFASPSHKATLVGLLRSLQLAIRDEREAMLRREDSEVDGGG